LVFCAKGALSFQAGVSPQELTLPTEKALKAQVFIVSFEGTWPLH
jgi:hypothetical protein